MGQQVVVLKSNQKQNLEIRLIKKGQNHELYVFFVGKNKEHFQLSTLSQHLAVNAKSRVVVRGVLYDQSSARVDGMIKIEKDVSGSDAFLDQKILMVGEKSRADVRPGLEISNNEVKASHAASVGKLDQEQLFYLMSRGLSQKQAVETLVKGFFQNLITKIEDIKMKIKLEKVLV